MNTWLYEGVVGDFEGGEFLFRGHAGVPEHLHLLFRLLSVRVTEERENGEEGIQVLKEERTAVGLWHIKINSGPVLTVQEPTHAHARAWQSAALTFAFSRLALISAPPVTENSPSPSQQKGENQPAKASRSDKLCR